LGKTTPLEYCRSLQWSVVLDYNRTKEKGNMSPTKKETIVTFVGSLLEKVSWKENSSQETFFLFGRITVKQPK
jgi:hypothetical protein